MSGLATTTKTPPRSPLPPSRIPVARSRTRTSQVQVQPTSPDLQGVVNFALESETELRNITRELAKQPKSSPFLPLLSQCLSEVHARLETNPPNEDRLWRLLATLERLASWPFSFKTPKAPQGRYRTLYPRLDCLTRQPSQDRQPAQACVRALAEDSQPKTSHVRKLFVQTFQAFAGVKRQSLDVEYQEASTQLPKHDTTEYLQELYTSLQKLSRCDGVDHEFRANTALGTVSRSCETEEGIAIELFLMHRHNTARGEKGEWREARINVCGDRHDPSSKPRVRFAPTGEKIEVSNFCPLLRSPQFSSVMGRLKLRASRGSLFHEGFDHLGSSDISLQAYSVPLSTVLKQACLRQLPRSVILPYLLSQAVYQFYDSDWMAKGWTADTVHFMWQYLDSSPRDSLLHHRPFVSVALHNPVQRSKETHEGPRDMPLTHRFPKILALGIMLLEILLGDRLEKQYPPGSLDSSGRPRPNVEHITAAKIVTSKAWSKRKDVPSAIKESIEFCLNPDHGESGPEPTSIRDRLYRSVVARLEKLYKDMYNDGSPPEDIDCGPIPYDARSPGFDTAAMEQANQAPSSYHQTPLELGPPPDLSFPIESKLCEDSSRIWHSTQLVVEELQLFGLEQDSSDLGLRSEADRFMASLKSRCVKFGTGRQSRIKVCIIDTGIDMSHVHLRKHHSDRIKDQKAFNGGSPLVDASGHGTHIAGILLDLAPNVDLYIAKFTESQQADLAPISVRGAVSEALRHARTFWKVDMISLSFGFRHTGGPDEVRDEVDKCLNAGITVFASASNDSGHKPRTYPGNYDRVLCIHSTSGGGNKSHFNPTDAPPETKEDNFSTVGECVKSYWPAAADNMGDLSASGRRYMSGTSFATPVAVAIAAFMVGYIEKKIPAYGWNIKPMSPEGMRKIFRLMSHKRDRYDWISPEWFFASYREEKIRYDIIHALQGYPKG